jgi:hypothetical protein
MRAPTRSARVRAAWRAAAAGATVPFTYRSDLPLVAGDPRRPLAIGPTDHDAVDAEIRAHLASIRRRLWLQRAVFLLVRAGLLAAAWCLLVASLRLVGAPLPPSLAALGAAAIAAVAGAIALRQRVTFADAARVVDRRLGLPQVVGTAVELTAASDPGRLALAQRRRATDLLHRLDGRRAFRIHLPRRDLRALALTALAALLVAYLSTLSIAWPGTVPLTELAVEPDADAAAGLVITPTVVEAASAEAGQLDPLLLDPALDGPRQELAAQNLPPEEQAARLAAIQAELAQRAEALSRARQALGDLADGLSDSSATREAAESIRRGEYQRAADQLRALAGQSDQLSASARQDLARQLDEAAGAVAANNRDLAAQARQSAQQLAAADPRAAGQALSDLADGVARAGQQADALADQSQPLDPSAIPQAGDAQPSDGAGGQPSDQADGQSSDGTGEQASGQPSDQGGGQPSGASGQEPGATGAPGGSSDQAGAAPGQGEPGGSGADGRPTGQSGDAAAGSGQSEAGGAGGAGAGPGRDGSAAEGDLGGERRVIELRGRPSPGGESSPDLGAQVPLVSSNDGGVDRSASASGGGLTSPVDVRGEQNVVPIEKRQIVRDYFGGTGS